MSEQVDERDLYNEGYKDGFERWREKVERLELILADMQKQYDYLLKLRTDELMFQLPQPFFIVSERQAKEKL